MSKLSISGSSTEVVSTIVFGWPGTVLVDSIAGARHCFLICAPLPLPMLKHTVRNNCPNWLLISFIIIMLVVKRM